MQDTHTPEREQGVHLTPEAKRCYRMLWSGHGSGQHPTVTGKCSELSQNKEFVRKKPSSEGSFLHGNHAFTTIKY